MVKETWKKLKIAGKYYERIKNLKNECPTCRVHKNQFHKLGCDLEFCPHCELKLIECNVEGYDIMDETTGRVNNDG
jgi:hypothetical protein